MHERKVERILIIFSVFTCIDYCLVSLSSISVVGILNKVALEHGQAEDATTRSNRGLMSSMSLPCAEWGDSWGFEITSDVGHYHLITCTVIYCAKNASDRDPCFEQKC